MINMNTVRNRPIREEIKRLASEGILGEINKGDHVCPHYIREKAEAIIRMSKQAEAHHDTEEEYIRFHGADSETHNE